MSIAPLSALQRRQAEVLGVKVDLATMDETVAHLDALLQGDTLHLVATADASGIYMAQKDPALAAIYAQASHVTADSYGVVWALRRQGIDTPRVSGVDVADRLIALSAQKGYRVYLLGAAPGVPEAAAERLRLIHPGCNIVGTRHGYFPASDDQVVAEEVAKAEPDILLVAMGIPRQEKFILATQSIIKAKIAVGVGGSFDVWSGRAKRAPLIIQKMKLEWLWRLLLNPSKISKARTLPRFAWRVLKSGR
jgi:N-acetylglucosaminyldiphosphoundecaprenol N-acetyl-beta-D-mannosaminyltransferase